jgi:hypothetical protein
MEVEKYGRNLYKHMVPLGGLFITWETQQWLNGAAGHAKQARERLQLRSHRLGL